MSHCSETPSDPSFPDISSQRKEKIAKMFNAKSSSNQQASSYYDAVGFAAFYKSNYSLLYFSSTMQISQMKKTHAEGMLYAC
jgi:hypothetical protein